MNVIRKMIVGGSVAIIFICFVTLLIFASRNREKLERSIYRENRLERLIPISEIDLKDRHL